MVRDQFVDPACQMDTVPLIVVIESMSWKYKYFRILESNLFEFY